MSISLRPHELHSPWNFPGQNTGMGSLSLLQGIFLTQKLNRALLHCRQIPYQLSNQGSPTIFLMCAQIKGKHYIFFFFLVLKTVLSREQSPLYLVRYSESPQARECLCHAPCATAQF